MLPTFPTKNAHASKEKGQKESAVPKEKGIQITLNEKNDLGEHSPGCFEEMQFKMTYSQKQKTLQKI